MLRDAPSFMPKSNQDYTATEVPIIRYRKGQRRLRLRAAAWRPDRARRSKTATDPTDSGSSDSGTSKTRAARSVSFALLLVTALLIGGAAITLWRQRDAERAKTNKAISQPLAPQSTPTSVQTLNTWRAQLAAHPEQFPYVNAAPRATLVKLLSPRAQLVRLPEWRVGETRPVMMPYNLEVLTSYLPRAAGRRMDAAAER